MKNGYGHRYRLAPLSFFLSPRLLRKGRGKKHNSAPYIKLLVCFRKWDGDPTTCRWPDVKERTNLGRSSYPTPGHTHTHTQKSAPTPNVMHYKEPLGIIRSIIPPFFSSSSFYMRGPHPVHVWVFVADRTRKKWGVVWISIEPKKTKRGAPCFIAKYFFLKRESF